MNGRMGAWTNKWMESRWVGRKKTTMIEERHQFGAVKFIIMGILGNGKFMAIHGNLS